MTYRQYSQQHSALITEARSYIPADGQPIAAENRKRFDSLMNQAQTLKNDYEQSLTSRPPRSQPGSEARASNSDLEKRAFRDWMRTGQVSEENRSYLRTAETRDMGVGAIGGAITGGNVLVPTGFDPQLHSALLSAGSLVNAVRGLNTDTGQPIRIALDDDTANTLTLISEATAAPEVDVPVSGLTSNVDELTTGLVTVSNQLLNDSAFSVDDFIETKFAVRYYRGLAKMIAQGNGSNVQKLSPSVTITAPAGETTSVTYGLLVDLFSALDPIHTEQASFVLTAQTKGQLMKMTDNYGHPLLQPDATGKPFNSLFGRPLVISPFSDQMTAGKTPILFGDLSSYTLRTVGGLQIGRSEQRFFERNETAYVGFARVGGYNTSQASSPAIVGLTMAAS